MERRLTHVNWMEIEGRLTGGERRVLLPVGSLEAHGALAQGTDILAPGYLCERLAEPLSAWIAPGIPYGVTRQLAAYPGTVHVEADVFSMGKLERDAQRIETLPGSLIEAIEIAEGSKLVASVLGDHLFGKFLLNKKIEWDSYRVHVSDLEIKNYLPIL